MAFPGLTADSGTMRAEVAIAKDVNPLKTIIPSIVSMFFAYRHLMLRLNMNNEHPMVSVAFPLGGSLETRLIGRWIAAWLCGYEPSPGPVMEPA
jgi:hypothetical protein